jgi:hypothetical protein
MEIITIATLGFLLSVKHTICDLALQRLFPAEKKYYFDPPAHIHYFHHAVGSLLAGCILGWQFAVLIAAIDYVAHWNIDYIKTKIRDHYNMVSTEDRYWVLQTADQALHFATYYLFVLIAITW